MILNDEIHEMATLKMLEQDISWKMEVLIRKYGKTNVERAIRASGYWIILQEAYFESECVIRKS